MGSAWKKPAPGPASAAIDEQDDDDAPPPAVMPCAKKQEWVAFKVVDQDGKPVSKVDLVVRQKGEPVQLCATDDNGAARLDGMKPGTCRLKKASGEPMFEFVSIQSA